MPKCSVHHIKLILRLAFVLVLSGCSEAVAVQQVPFTEIKHGDALGLGAGKPGLFIIATAADLHVVAEHLSPNHPLLGQLRQLDYEQVFVVVVERGSSIDPDIHVQQVTRVGDQVGVHTINRIEGRFGAMTNPGEIIAVTKTGTWGRPTQFALLFEGKTIAKATHVIP